MHMSRAEAIEIRTKQLSGAHVDKDALQIAVLVIARTVHEPEKKIRKRAGRPPNADNLPGAGQELAWAAQKECANRLLLTNLSKHVGSARLACGLTMFRNEVSAGYRLPARAGEADLSGLPKWMLLGQPGPTQS